MQRRSFVAGVGTGALATVAGCAALLGGSGNGDGWIPPVGRWAIAPGPDAVRHPEYRSSAFTPRAVLEASDAVGPQDLATGVGSGSVVWRAVAPTELEHVVQVSPPTTNALAGYTVFEGAFDAETVVTALDEGPNYERERLGSYRGYEIHDTGAGFFFHAIDDGVAIEVGRLQTRGLDRSAIEAIIDAGEGRSNRLGDVHDGVTAVLQQLDREHWTSVRVEDPDGEGDPASGEFRGVVATGGAASIDDEQSVARAILVFADAATREAAPIQRYLGEQRGQDGVESIESEANGRRVEVRLTLDYPAPFASE